MKPRKKKKEKKIMNQRNQQGEMVDRQTVNKRNTEEKKKVQVQEQ
jgi:hypothetical protein